MHVAIDLTEVFQPCADEISKAFPDLILKSNAYMADEVCGNERRFKFFSGKTSIQTNEVLELIKLFAEVNDLNVSIPADNKSNARILKGADDIGWILITNHTGEVNGALAISIIQNL